MGEVFKDAWQMIQESNVLQLVWAVLILLVGWLMALWASGTVRKLCGKVPLAGKVNACLREGTDAPGADVGKIAGTATYILILLFAILCCLTALDLSQAAAPLQKFFDTLTGYAANLIGAALLAVMAWVVATLARGGTVTAVRLLGVEQKLAEYVKEKDGGSLGKTVAQVVYWIVLLFFLPAILRALKVDGITGPVEQMFAKLLDFVPQLIAAAAILAIGLFAASIIRKAVTGLAVLSRLDQAGENAGLSKVFGDQGLSGMLGILAYALVAIPVVISALTALKIESLSNSVTGLFDKLLSVSGDIFGAAVLLFIAYLCGNFVAGLVTQLGENFGLNTLPAKLGCCKDSQAACGLAPARFAGKIAFTIVMLLAAIAAAEILSLLELANLLRTLTQFGATLLLGLVVLIIGIWLANLAASAVQAKTNPLVVIIVRVTVLVFTGAIAIHSTGIGGPIVLTAFTFLLGSVCVAVALAFGLGGREFAADKLRQWNEMLRRKE